MISESISSESAPSESTPSESARGTNVLEISDVTKTFGEITALDGVSLTVPGGVFGLLGANGAGKSTLFKAILDLVRPDSGQILVDGLDVRHESVEARRRLGYLPEEPELYDHLSGEEFLAFVAGLKGYDNAEERREWLHLFGLTARADRYVGSYSLGMRKKIGLSAALMGRPRLVLLDEPLNGLDTESMRLLRLRIETMAAGGTTFVLSSHVMSFIERICDRVAILRRGRLVAQGTPEELGRQAGFDGQPFEDVFLHFALDSEASSV